MHLYQEDYIAVSSELCIRKQRNNFLVLFNSIKTVAKVSNVSHGPHVFTFLLSYFNNKKDTTCLYVL